MKRDMDLIRRIILDTGELGPTQPLEKMEGINPHVFSIHVRWLQEAGLIVASIQEFQSGEPPITRVHRLTWDGCEFFDTIKDDTLWNKAKEKVIKPTSAFTFRLLKDWLAEEVKNGFPTLGRAVQ